MMQFPMLSASEMDIARVHRHNPHDLHWRKEPPAWPGRVDSAYRRLYPHLVDEFCCMQCGAIPCPFDHAEDRDTRLQDMSFVGDVVREKKEQEGQLAQLKERLSLLQQARDKWNSEKQKFQKSICEQEAINKKRESEKLALLQETSRLRANNTKLQMEMNSIKKDLERLPFLEQELEKLQIEHKELTEENDLQKRMISDHSAKVISHSKDTERENQLKQELENLRTNFESMLESRIQETEMERARVTTELMEKVNLLETLQERLRDSEAREFTSMNAVIDLRNELETVRVELGDVISVKDVLEKRLKDCEREMDRLRRRLEDNRGFQRYVGVLRELNQTKDINDDLRWKLDAKPSVSLTTLGSRGQYRRASTVGDSTKSLGPPSTGRKSTVGYSIRSQTAIREDRTLCNVQVANS